MTVLLFTRFYNLDKTSRFLWDESSDLVKMHQYYVEKRLSLVGPVTEDGTRVYSSLTYYMLMPFAILGHFDPASTAYGTAFWGTLTALLIIYLTFKMNQKLIIPVSVLTLVWYPLIETSRWAWNPNLIPFWATLGLVFYLRKDTVSFLLSGIFLGLMIHQHYLALFPITVFALINLVYQIKKRQIAKATLPFIGILFTISPFIIFDLSHPPGLFLTRVLYFNNSSFNISFPLIIEHELTWISYMLNYYTKSVILGYLLLFSTIGLVIFDIKNKSKALFFALPWTTHLICLIFIYNSGSVHYLLPSTIFYLAWVIFKRDNFANKLSLILLSVLIIGGLFSIKPQLTKVTWQSDIYSTREITNFIDQTITKDNLKNINLAVLASDDNNTYGRRYRDLLLIRGNLIISKYQYDLTDNLFVISTSSEKAIRSDPAAEMNNFRSGPLKEKFDVQNSIWHIYLFQKNPLTS